MKLQDDVKEHYKKLCKEAINNELVEDQGQFKEVFVRTMNNTECQDLLARHFDGDENDAGFQKTVLNFVKTEFMTLLRVQTEKFRFYLSSVDHTTLAERDDKTKRYPAAFGFGIVQKWDKDTGDWEDQCEADIQAFREASDNMRITPGEWYQGNFEIAGLQSQVYTLRVHPQASRFDRVDSPDGWTNARDWLKENYDMMTISDINDNPSSDGRDFRLFELTMISSYIRGTSTGKQIGFMEFVDDSVSLSLMADKENRSSVRSIVSQEQAATYARGSTFLALAIVEINPQYGPQLSIKMLEEIIPIKRRSYKTTVGEEEEEEEEIDASAWIQSKMDDSDDDGWDSDEDDSDEIDETDEESEEEDFDEEEESDEDSDEDDSDEEWEDLDDEL